MKNNQINEKEKIKAKKIDKQTIAKKIMAGTLAFLMVLSVGVTLIACLMNK